MTKPFKGVINLDIRDSTPDWEPYVQPKAPEGAPNVLFIVWDDTGIGALAPFGGPIEMPTLQRLVRQRASLHAVPHDVDLLGDASVAADRPQPHDGRDGLHRRDDHDGFPGSNGHIPFETATIAEVLGERGYNTYALGKWHVVAEDETNMASSKRNWPTGRGFERYYGYLGGETNQWYPDLVQDQQFVEQPADPPKDGKEWAEGLGDKYHLSRDLVDRAIGMIADAKQIAPDRPFFMYFCPGANHAPHHSPKEWADKYKGASTRGTRAIRESILAKQKKLGICPGEHGAVADQPAGRREERRRQGTVRRSTSCARGTRCPTTRRRSCAGWPRCTPGYCSYTDHEIGRLIDYLEQSGELDNTLIVWLSDNGASGEGGPNGSVNENKVMNGVPDDMKDNFEYLDVLGSPETYNHYSTGWAFAFNTPVQDVQAPHLGRRRRRPDGRALAKRHQGQGRDPPPVHARQRHRPDRVRVPGHRAARGRQGLHAVGHSRARASSTASTTPRRRRRSRASST